MDEKNLTLVEHLDELRKRIIIIAASILLGTILSYSFIDIMVEYIVKPSKGLEFIYLSPPELFLSYIKISVLSGLILSSPIILLQIWLFVKPGLEKTEKRYLLIAMFMGIIFFAIGASFSYFTIIPISIDFFIKLSVQDVAPLFSFDKYLSFVISLLLSFGLVFELPMLIILLTQLNLINARILKKYRKIIILVIFVVAAVLTPPDVISQTLLALPMLFLYELSIWAAVIIGKKKDKKKNEKE